MATGFFALLDDIAVLMDDVATMSKVATKKTAGILGDDLAVNAEKATGFVSDRELPVLWSITKGSFINKLIILPLAFLMSAYVPWLIVPILLCGGAFLGYEGIVKILEYASPNQKDKTNPKKKLLEMTPEEAVAHEKKKVRSAVLIDFILSVEIVIIALSTVLEAELTVQIMVVSVVALLATVGVYGIVALIVRMDDFGYALSERDSSSAKSIGKVLINGLPWVIKALGVIGTIALILVSGGIFTHNIHQIHDFLHALPSLLADTLVGLAVGVIVYAVVWVVKKVLGKG